MTIRELIIAPEVKDEKSRAFRAVLLAEVFADSLWEGGEGGDQRPAWMMYACTPGEASPFTANLRLGRKATLLGTQPRYSRRGNGTTYELMKSVGYTYAPQRLSAGVVMTAFLPGLFMLDSGMVDPAGAKFVVLPERRHIFAQGIRVPKPERIAKRLDVVLEPGAAADLAAIAPLFCAYLDRRTRAPIPPDPVFFFRVLIACLRDKLATLAQIGESYHRAETFGDNRHFGFRESGTADVGLMPGIAFCATHEAIEALLAEQTKEHFARKAAA